MAGARKYEFPIFRNCEHCGKEMVITDKNKARNKYCSRPCSARAIAKSKIGTNYDVLGNESYPLEFESDYSDTVYEIKNRMLYAKGELNFEVKILEIPQMIKRIFLKSDTSAQRIMAKELFEIYDVWKAVRT